MLEKSSAVWVAILVLAAVSGCAEVGGAPDAGDDTDGAQEPAGEGGGGVVTAGKGGGVAPIAPAGCPQEHPKIGLPCLVPENEVCTYWGDGACSPTNPDRLAVCTSGKWTRVAPAIACPPVDCDRPLTLADFCDRPGRDCGVSLESMKASYCSSMLSHFNTRLQSNACGGTTLLTRLGNSGMRFDYDGSGQLRSVQSYDDVPYGACKKYQYVYGTSCELSGMPAPACAVPPEDDAGI